MMVSHYKKLICALVLNLIVLEILTVEGKSKYDEVEKYIIETLEDYEDQASSAGWHFPSGTSTWSYNDTHGELGGNGVFIFDSLTNSENTRIVSLLGMFMEYQNRPQYLFNITIKYYTLVPARLTLSPNEYEFPLSEGNNWSYLSVNAETPIAAMFIEFTIPQQSDKYFLLDTLETVISDCPSILPPTTTEATGTSSTTFEPIITSLTTDKETTESISSTTSETYSESTENPISTEKPCTDVENYMVDTLEDYEGQAPQAGWQLPSGASTWSYTDKHEDLGGNGVFIFESLTNSENSVSLLGMFMEYQHKPQFQFNITIKYYSLVSARLTLGPNEYEFPLSEGNTWSYLDVNAETPIGAMIIEFTIPQQSDKYFLLDTVQTVISYCSPVTTTTSITSPTAVETTVSISSTTSEKYPESTESPVSTSTVEPCVDAGKYIVGTLEDYEEQELSAGWQLPSGTLAWSYSDSHEELGGNGVFIFDSLTNSENIVSLLGMFIEYQNRPQYLFNITIKYYSLIPARLTLGSDDYDFPISGGNTWSYLDVQAWTPIGSMLIEFTIPQQSDKYFLLDTLETVISHCPELPSTTTHVTEISSISTTVNSVTSMIPCIDLGTYIVETLEDYESQEPVAGWQIPKESSIWYYTETHELLGGNGVFIFNLTQNETNHIAILGIFNEYNNSPGHVFNIGIKYYSLVPATLTINGNVDEFPISENFNWCYMNATVAAPTGLFMIDIFIPQDNGNEKYFLLDTIETAISYCPEIM